MNIEEAIKTLNPEIIAELDNEIIPCLSDECWCTMNDINHVNPDVRKARKVIYHELLEFVIGEYEQKGKKVTI